MLGQLGTGGWGVSSNEDLKSQESFYRRGEFGAKLNVGRTGVPGEEPVWARAWLYESLGCFKRQLDRRLGIWASFMVLPLTHYIMFSRPPLGPCFLLQLTLSVKTLSSSFFFSF